MDLKHRQFKHPFNCLVVGQTGTGKTLLIRRVLSEFSNQIYNLNKNKINVLWAYGQWQALIDIPIGDNVNIVYVEGLPKEDLIKKSKPDILIIDDLMSDINKDPKFEDIFTKMSHHLNFSVFFIIQNAFYQAKSMRTISINQHYIILFKNTRDKTQVSTLARQMYPDKTKYFIDAYNDATTKAFGYLRVDLTTDTPDNMRLISNLTQKENIWPIIYMINN